VFLFFVATLIHKAARSMSIDPSGALKIISKSLKTKTKEFNSSFLKLYSERSG